MATTPTPAAPKQPLPYRITSSADQMIVGANGNLVQVKRIWFETLTGDTGHVDIPKSQFNAKVAQDAIEAEVDQLLTLHGI